MSPLNLGQCSGLGPALRGGGGFLEEAAGLGPPGRLVALSSEPHSRTPSPRARETACGAVDAAVTKARPWAPKARSQEEGGRVAARGFYGFHVGSELWLCRVR